MQEHIRGSHQDTNETVTQRNLRRSTAGFIGDIASPSKVILLHNSRGCSGEHPFVRGVGSAQATLYIHTRQENVWLRSHTNTSTPFCKRKCVRARFHVLPTLGGRWASRRLYSSPKTRGLCALVNLSNFPTRTIAGSPIRRARLSPLVVSLSWFFFLAYSIFSFSLPTSLRLQPACIFVQTTFILHFNFSVATFLCHVSTEIVYFDEFCKNWNRAKFCFFAKSWTLIWNLVAKCGKK